MANDRFTRAGPALNELWQLLDLPQQQLSHTALTGELPALPSSFAVTTAAQASIAAAASAACLIAGQRNKQGYSVSVNSTDAVLECTSLFTINGTQPPKWAEYSGLYETADGHIRIHANFDHHRDCLFNALKLPPLTNKAIVEAEVKKVTTSTLDALITELGGACAVMRSFEQWDKLEQAAAVASLPLIELTRINDAAPRKLTANSTSALNGIRVLDLTRILAGPVCGRALAAYGADVMLVNSPHLPNIESIIETSRGKLSTHIDLKTEPGAQALHQLLNDAHVFVQGYRPTALSKLGFDTQSLCNRYPGLVTISLSAYGRTGPWSEKRGFDSLIQTATGFNVAEARAYNSAKAKPMPVQILDYATGFLMAYGAQAALYKQLTEGGSYHVQVSLARTALWLRDMGQSIEHLQTPTLDTMQYLKAYESGYGELMALPHAAQFGQLANGYSRPSVQPGTHLPQWPNQKDSS